MILQPNVFGLVLVEKDDKIISLRLIHWPCVLLDDELQVCVVEANDCQKWFAYSLNLLAPGFLSLPTWIG